MLDQEHTIEDALLQSLCYLYRECCLHELDEIGLEIRNTIERIEKIIPSETVLSQQSQDSLYQFYFLKKFSMLSNTQKQQVLKEIDFVEHEWAKRKAN